MHNLIVFEGAKDVEDAIDGGDVRQESVAQPRAL